MPKKDPTCEQTGCPDAKIPGSKFCFFHDFQQRRAKAGEKSFRKGDTWGGLLNHGVAFLASMARASLLSCGVEPCEPKTEISR